MSIARFILSLFSLLFFVRCGPSPLQTDDTLEVHQTPLPAEADEQPISLEEPIEQDSQERPERSVVLENFNTGIRREVTLYPGEIFSLSWTPRLPYIYQEEDRIVFSHIADSLEVNGQTVGLILSNNRPVNSSYLTQYRGSLRSIIVRGAGELNPELASDISQLAADQIVISLELYGDTDLKTNRLSSLGERLVGLLIRNRTQRSSLETLDMYPALEYLSIRGVTDSEVEAIRDLENLRTLVISQAEFSPLGMSHIYELVGLEELFLIRSEITDDGLSNISELERLREIEISNAPITDRGVEYLSELPNLQELFLYDSQITDSGLSHIGRLNNLRVLGLSVNQIGDTGLVHLSQLTQLRALHLERSLITNAGLGHIAALNGLQILTLNNTQITDDGLAHLANLTQLHHLHLDRTQVTDAGLNHLSGLTNLRYLSVRNTQVTENAAEAFQNSHPDCLVMY